MKVRAPGDEEILPVCCPLKETIRVILEDCDTRGRIHDSKEEVLKVADEESEFKVQVISPVLMNPRPLMTMQMEEVLVSPWLGVMAVMRGKAGL